MVMVLAAPVAVPLPTTAKVVFKGSKPNSREERPLVLAQSVVVLLVLREVMVMVSPPAAAMAMTAKTSGRIAG